jgi:Type II intron maturase/Reverse transcriptase (RNA-dependent DNA polymerase)
LDKFVETVLMPEYTRGVRRTPSPEYSRVRNAIYRARKRGDHAAVRALRKQQRSLPVLDSCDPGYRRLRYTRYADDILLGFTGPKTEAEEIKRRLAQFLQEELKLELSKEKTLITHARTSAARFLGYEITTQHANQIITDGRRVANGPIRLRVPGDVIKTKCARYMQRGKPERRPELLNDEDHSIISRYGSEYRGVVQYYLLAGGVYRLDRLYWVMVTSLLKTPAGKYDSSVSKMARKYGGHDRDAARAAQMPTGQRRPWRGQEAAGRNLRRYSATAAEERGPAGPRTSPSPRPTQGANPSAPRRTVRALRASGRGARAPNPQTRRPRQARSARTARLDEDHGQTAAQDPGGLRQLPRQHPPPAANHVKHE